MDWGTLFNFIFHVGRPLSLGGSCVSHGDRGSVYAMPFFFKVLLCVVCVCVCVCVFKINRRVITIVTIKEKNDNSI